MKSTATRLRLVHDAEPREQELGDCASRTVATHEPSQSSLSWPSRVSVELSRCSATIRPTFICRTHKAPVPRGHRAYLEPKLGER